MSAVIYHGPQPPSQNGYELLAAHAIKLQHELMRALKAECERDEARAAASWAVQWLDTVIDRLQHEATIAELFEDMVKVREKNSVLDNEWNRCGWTGTQAERFLKNWRKEEA